MLTFTQYLILLCPPLVPRLPSCFVSSEFPTFEEYGFCVVACSGTLPLESWVGSGLSLSGHGVWNLTTYCGCFQRARRSELVFNFKSIYGFRHSQVSPTNFFPKYSVIHSDPCRSTMVWWLLGDEERV